MISDNEQSVQWEISDAFHKSIKYSDVGNKWTTEYNVI